MRVLWLALFAALASGCAELPELTAGSCGNGIVEEGEDCDTQQGSCREPGDPLECRYDCSENACPAGWGCGVDGICRLASGEFESRGFSGHEITVSVATADFDADGRDDVVAAEPSRAVVYYHDASGRLTATSTIGMFGPDMYPGQLTADEPALAEPASFVSALDSVTIARGSEDRRLTRVAYAPFDVDQSSWHYIAFDLTTQVVGDEIVGFLPHDDEDAASILWIGPADEILFDVPYVAESTLALNANLDLASPCEELLLVAAGWSEVRTYPTCNKTNAGWAPNKGATPKAWTAMLPDDWKLPPAPEMPAARRVQREKLATLGDLNSDGLLDLIVLAEKSSNGKRELFAAYGVGNGTFHSDPETIPEAAFPGDTIAAGDGKLKALVLTVPIAGAFVDPTKPTNAHLPLAIGSLNGDSRVDFVSPTHIWLSDDGSCPPNRKLLAGYCGELPAEASDVWSQAAISDLNLDGRADVVALPAAGSHLDFYAGVPDDPELFNRTEIHPIGLIRRFLLGDFDGDQVTDIALHENRGGLEDTSSLAIAWGRLFGSPAAPISVARFPEIAALVAANFPSFETGAIDGIADIGLISGQVEEGPDATGKLSDLRAALFYGRGDRELQSPYQYIGYDARRAAVGSFDGDQHADVACLIERQENENTPETAAKHGLLLIPMSGTAQISPRDVQQTPLDDPRITTCGTRALSVDLDGDLLDELVVVGKEAGKWAGWTLVARAAESDDGTRSFEIAQLESTPELVFDGVVAMITCQTGLESLQGDSQALFLSYAGELAKGDLNADGRDDVVALGYGDFQAGERPRPELVIHPNLGTGVLDIANRIRIELPRYLVEGNRDTGPSAATLALMQADSDPQLEIVIGNLAGAVVIDAVLGPSGEIASLGEPRIITGPTAGEEVRPEDLLFASSSASGDIDGDGVQDLVLSALTGVQVFYGIPVLR